MTAWRTYADPPQSDPGLSRAERRAVGRRRRDEVDFGEALTSSATGYTVWMCADALAAALSPQGIVLDAVHVDDALPGPWEADLMHLVLGSGMHGRAAEAAAEGYQQALAAVASEPMHAARAEALRRSRRLADSVSADAAWSSATALRRLVSPDARLRQDRVAAAWDSDAVALDDPAPELAQYRESLPEADARLLAQYRATDALASTDGRLIVLMARGTDREDALLLAANPARPSTREQSYGAWRDGSDVQRVLLAREAVPLVPAEFAGWSTSPDGSVARVWSRARASAAEPDLGGARGSARRLGAALGLLHATSGDAAMLAGYVGQSARFPAAVRRAARGA